MYLSALGLGTPGKMRPSIDEFVVLVLYLTKVGTFLFFEDI